MSDKPYVREIDETTAAGRFAAALHQEQGKPIVSITEDLQISVQLGCGHMSVAPVESAEKLIEALQSAVAHAKRLREDK